MSKKIKNKYSKQIRKKEYENLFSKSELRNAVSYDEINSERSNENVAVKKSLFKILPGLLVSFIFALAGIILILVFIFGSIQDARFSTVRAEVLGTYEKSIYEKSFFVVRYNMENSEYINELEYTENMGNLVSGNEYYIYVDTANPYNIKPILGLQFIFLAIGIPLLVFAAITYYIGVTIPWKCNYSLENLWGGFTFIFASTLFIELAVWLVIPDHSFGYVFLIFSILFLVVGSGILLKEIMSARKEMRNKK